MRKRPHDPGLPLDPERIRLDEDRKREKNWKRWGPYLSERQWGTVREDYSPHGAAWDYFPHEHARSRAYRWGEDGLMGLSDRHQYVCFSLALWNGKDPILKERLFGLSGPQGNHGEDVKECYYYLDSTPTHSYMKALYKYPQREFPYQWLLDENRRRSRTDPEFELVDTGIFDDDRYFDVFHRVREGLARRRPDPRAGLQSGPGGRSRARPPDDLVPQHVVVGPRHPPPAASRGRGESRPPLDPGGQRVLRQARADVRGRARAALHRERVERERLWDSDNESTCVKDGFHDYVVDGVAEAVSSHRVGSKGAARYVQTIPAGGSVVLRLRLTRGDAPAAAFGEAFEGVFEEREREADAFYATLATPDLSDDARAVQRQAFAGMLWSKQFYHYDVHRWLRGDPGRPRAAGGAPQRPQQRVGPPPQRRRHLDARQVGVPVVRGLGPRVPLHPLALVDPDFAKQQLVLLLREWYMHPNGQLPAYEWAFGDVNPPVHAWSAWRVYKIDKKRTGRGDRKFLERVFHKLLLNFTWWINRKDAEGKNVFQGGFLGLDNIGVFDRSAPLPTGGHIEQSDATSWMGCTA
jgi:hypothetical protein